MTRYRLVRIDVTQDDIDHGVPLDIEHCPVARAMHRVFPGTELAVVAEALYIGSCIARPPARVSAFISDFDRGHGRRQGPFTFALRWDEAAGGWAAA